MKNILTLLFSLCLLFAYGQNDSPQKELNGNTETDAVVKVDPESQNVSNTSFFSTEIVIEDVTWIIHKTL